MTLMTTRGYPSAEQAMAVAMTTLVEVGDEVTQHEATCDLTEHCGCRVIVYRLAEDGWQVVQ